MCCWDDSVRNSLFPDFPHDKAMCKEDGLIRFISDMLFCNHHLQKAIEVLPVCISEKTI